MSVPHFPTDSGRSLRARNGSNKQTVASSTVMLPELRTFRNITQIQITAPPGRYDLHLEVFKTMAQHHISVDFINVSPSGVVYTVLEKDAEKASALLRQFGYEPTLTPHCAKVAVLEEG